jgi:hypothetical protein
MAVSVAVGGSGVKVSVGGGAVKVSVGIKVSVTESGCDVGEDAGMLHAVKENIINAISNCVFIRFISFFSKVSRLYLTWTILPVACINGN